MGGGGGKCELFFIGDTRLLSAFVFNRKLERNSHQVSEFIRRQNYLWIPHVAHPCKTEITLDLEECTVSYSSMTGNCD